MAGDIPYRLPSGQFSSLLSGASESLAFHASPQSFISSRISAYDKARLSPSDVSRHEIVRAKILNRHVAIISSHGYVSDILTERGGEGKTDEESALCNKQGSPLEKVAFESGAAYMQLMKDFFPPPNLLLLDSPEHKQSREIWNGRIASLSDRTRETQLQIIEDHFESLLLDASEIDLYENMKNLSWKLLLHIFLDLDESSPNFAAIESLQEDLLRGQFSLFPISINTGLWRSARSTGIDARKKLQAKLAALSKARRSGCPFAPREKTEENDVAVHLLLFTSSLAVKGLASLLMASLLNLHLFPSSPSLANQVRSLEDSKSQDALLNSILLETERLSPPVVGAMRRAKGDVVLRGNEDNGENILIPAGWDAWLYFIGASRDPQVFQNADLFDPGRYIYSSEDLPCGFAFGDGPKTCPGSGIARQIVRTVSEVTLARGIHIKGTVSESGVKAWLGWENDIGAEAWKRDMKQLPTQRPLRPIKVTISHPD